ncbi:MAG TPA: DUF2892 domain-containing protein [Flavisolibacter sp.]|jgi:hypothetical protein|nr:DUF2892 domain-containing protein [Flavisolibacter sp.]
MKKNMGILDRILRALAALVILFFFYEGFIYGAAGIFLFVVAAVFLFTSILGNCPLYTLLGLQTCRAPSKNKRHA